MRATQISDEIWEVIQQWETSLPVTPRCGKEEKKELSVQLSVQVVCGHLVIYFI